MSEKVRSYKGDVRTNDDMFYYNGNAAYCSNLDGNIYLSDCKTMYNTGIKRLQEIALRYHSKWEMGIEELPKRLINNSLQETVNYYNTQSTKDRERFCIVISQGKPSCHLWTWSVPDRSETIFVFRENALRKAFFDNFQKEITNYFQTTR